MNYEIRNENRFILHPQNKKRCTKCLIIYEGIRENFDIHHKTKSGEYTFSGYCKKCMSNKRISYKNKICTDISLYIPKLIPHIRYRANEQSLDFNLTSQHLIEQWNSQNGLCYYTKIKMDLSASMPKRNSPHKNFPSVDKKIPELGYVKGNIVWTLWAVNRMKSDLNESEFIDFCKLVVSNGNET